MRKHPHMWGSKKLPRLLNSSKNLKMILLTMLNCPAKFSRNRRQWAVCPVAGTAANTKDPTAVNNDSSFSYLHLISSVPFFSIFARRDSTERRESTGATTERAVADESERFESERDVWNDKRVRSEGKCHSTTAATTRTEPQAECSRTFRHPTTGQEIPPRPERRFQVAKAVDFPHKIDDAHGIRSPGQQWTCFRHIPGHFKVKFLFLIERKFRIQFIFGVLFSPLGIIERFW